MNFVIKKFVPLAACCSLILSFFTGCGKHETTGGIMGTATGGAIGAAVAKDTGTGALIGGLIGNVIGTAMGRSADDEEREEENERKERIHARQLALQEQENRTLRHQLTRWCVNCNRESHVAGANSCTACGGELVHEKFCSRCTTLFSPKDGYKYCPYCKAKVLLSSR